MEVIRRSLFIFTELNIYLYHDSCYYHTPGCTRRWLSQPYAACVGRDFSPSCVCRIVSSLEKQIFYRFFSDTTGSLQDQYNTKDDYSKSSQYQSLRDIGRHATSSASYSSNSSLLTTTTHQPKVFTKPFAPTSSDDIQLGMDVLVTRSRGQIGRGKVKYVGPLPGRRDTYIGIELGPGQGKRTCSVVASKFTSEKKIKTFPRAAFCSSVYCDKFKADGS